MWPMFAGLIVRSVAAMTHDETDGMAPGLGIHPAELELGAAKR
jgi:hypothetical protein